MRYGGLLTFVALALAGCGSSEDKPAAPSASETAVTADLGPNAIDEVATDAPPSPTGRTEKDENELYAFGYAYPDAAAAIPVLKGLLDGRLDAAKAELVSAAKSDQAEARKAGYPYRLHSFDTTWKIVSDLPDFLSLSAEIYGFSGGAHGMSNFDALVWDRRTNASVAPAAFFTSKDALRNAIQMPFCDALDKQRAERRGEPVQRDSGQPFTECIDPLANTLILGSSNSKAFDRIGVLVAPYEAGPYAEGSYEVTLPVTARVMAALKPQYRSSFSSQP